jgi:hypothetical protein
VEDYELLAPGHEDPLGLTRQGDGLLGGDLPLIGDDELGKLDVGCREKLPRAGAACSALAMVVPVDSHEVPLVWTPGASSGKPGGVGLLIGVLVMSPLGLQVKGLAVT